MSRGCREVVWRVPGKGLEISWMRSWRCLETSSGRENVAESSRQLFVKYCPFFCSGSLNDKKIATLSPIGNFSLGQVKLGHIKSRQVKSGQVKLGQVPSGQG